MLHNGALRLFDGETGDRRERVGIDTVQMEGKGFKLDVSKDMRVEEGDLLATVDLDAVKEAGFDPTTIVVVINTATLKSVAPVGATCPRWPKMPFMMDWKMLMAWLPACDAIAAH